MTIKCNICASDTAFFSDAIIMKKFAIKYYRCPNCGFVQTEEPYWLKEAYSRPINISDTGIMARNIYHANMASVLIRHCFSPKMKFADYGGGYGIFVRMMRDRGFDFYRDDKYCENLFAHGFDVADSGESRFELLTAFEVFEHFISPVIELENLFLKSDNILFSMDIIPDSPPLPSEWWFYGLDHGQHISFYTHKSLQYLAGKYGHYYYSRGRTHLFTRVKSSALSLIFHLATRPRVAGFIEVLSKRKSLTDSDYKQITGIDILSV